MIHIVGIKQWQEEEFLLDNFPCSGLCQSLRGLHGMVFP